MGQIHECGAGELGRFCVSRGGCRSSCTALTLASPFQVCIRWANLLLCQKVLIQCSSPYSPTSPSPDYVLCSKEIQPQLIAAFQSALEEFSATTKDSPAKSSLAEDSSYTKIVSPTHFARLEKLLETTKGRVAIGGGKNAETNKIEVTVIADVGEDDALMQGSS